MRGRLHREPPAKSSISFGMSRAQGDAVLFRTLVLQLQREMRETERLVSFWRKQQERHLAEPLSSASR